MSAFYFHVIERLPVFLHASRSRELTKAALGDRGTGWLLMMHNRDGAERHQARRAEQEYLTKLAHSNPDDFFHKWVQFTLIGNEAQDNLFRLFSAYVTYHKSRAFIRDLRIQQLFPEAEDARWPYGRVYRMAFPDKGSLRKSFMFELEIDTDRLQRFSGTLDGFTVEWEGESVWAMTGDKVVVQ